MLELSLLCVTASVSLPSFVLFKSYIDEENSERKKKNQSKKLERKGDRKNRKGGRKRTRERG